MLMNIITGNGGILFDIASAVLWVLISVALALNLGTACSLGLRVFGLPINIASNTLFNFFIGTIVLTFIVGLIGN